MKRYRVVKDVVAALQATNGPALPKIVNFGQIEVQPRRPGQVTVRVELNQTFDFMYHLFSSYSLTLLGPMEEDGSCILTSLPLTLRNTVWDGSFFYTLDFECGKEALQRSGIGPLLEDVE
jgi:hypothetical protein